MAKGGKQPGAGRPKGSVSDLTKMQQESMAIIKRRAFEATDTIMNSLLGSSRGSQYLYKIYTKKGEKGEPQLVTDPYEMQCFLRGDYDKSEENPNPVYYYFLTAKDPETKASEAILNRSHGRPKESLEVSNPDGNLKGVTIIKNYNGNK